MSEPTNQEIAEALLLPCPFCDSDKLEINELGDDDSYYVSCSHCHVQQIANYTKPEAIRRWNWRAPARTEEGD